MIYSWKAKHLKVYEMKPTRNSKSNGKEIGLQCKQIEVDK